MKKRLIALLVALCLAITMIAPASAVSSSNVVIDPDETDSISLRFDRDSDGLFSSSVLLDSFSKNERKVIDRQIGRLVDLGLFDSEGSKLISVDRNGTKDTDSNSNQFRYRINYGPFSETIEFLEDNDDRLSLHISGDGVDNVLTIYNNGKIILDGNEVTIYKDENITDMEVILKDDVTGTKSSDRWFQSTSPYGGAIDYSTYVSATNKASITLGSNIGSLSYSAAAAILALVSAPFSWAVGISAALWSVFRETAPESYGLSYKATKWRYKTSPAGGYISQIRKYVHRWNINWYARENYQSFVTNNNQYEVKVIY